MQYIKWLQKISLTQLYLKYNQDVTFDNKTFKFYYKLHTQKLKLNKKDIICKVEYNLIFSDRYKKDLIAIDVLFSIKREIGITNNYERIYDTPRTYKKTLWGNSNGMQI